jgi:hypothetical protein
MIKSDKPIFVAYINVDGIGRGRAEERIRQFIDNYGGTDIQIVAFGVSGSQETKLEVIWKGNDIEKMNTSGDNLNQVSKKLNIVLKLVEDGVSDPVIKQKLRTLQLEEILDVD